MANPHMRPASKDVAPDPARTYERADPDKEAGMGRLDNNKGTPTDSRDKIEDAVKQKQGLRQINADDVTDAKEEGMANGERVRKHIPRPDGSDIVNE
jgi:hypothetical protein